MRAAMAILLCSLALLDVPILVHGEQAVFRSPSAHSDVDTPAWLARIAEKAKQRRAIARAESAEALAVEISTQDVRDVNGSVGAVEPVPSAGKADGFANVDKRLRSSRRGSDAHPASSFLVASKEQQLEEQQMEVDPSQLDLDPPADTGDATLSVASSLTGQMLESLVHTPSATPFDQKKERQLEADQSQLDLDPPADQGDSTQSAPSSLTGQLLESLVNTPSATPFDEKKVVWVTAYPRSGSSSILAMISPPERDTWKTFTVFEPCVGRGMPWKKLMKEGCQSEVRRVTRCEYDGISHVGAKESFNGFTLYDADSLAAPSASGGQTAAACAASDVVALKTITYSHDLAEVVPMLEADPRLRVLDVVRDPRGIYASWLATEPFRGLVTGEHEPYWRRHDLGWFTNLTGICDQFQKNLHNPHPRIRRILFENLVKDPENVAKKNYEWLGLPFDDAAKSWLQANFDGDCPKEQKFSTCRSDSSASLLKWKEILPRKEQEAFTAHPACREIATFYGYPLE